MSLIGVVTLPPALPFSMSFVTCHPGESDYVYLCDYAMQPTPISRTADRNRPMLVIVQNPGVSDFAFTDNFTTEPIPNDTFTDWPDPSSSSTTEHEGHLQLRLRTTTGELNSTTTTTTTADSGSKNYHQDTTHVSEKYDCDWDANKGRVCDDHAEVDDPIAGYTEEVAVDVKGLKSSSYSFLPCENPCCDAARALHSRSNSSKSLQAASVQYQSYSK